MKYWKATLFLFSGLILMATYAYTAEMDPTIPRVPADQIDAAKAMKNPVPATPESAAKGKAVFEGKGTCFTCHGMSGQGDGEAGAALDPSPRNFSNTQWQDLRSDGEMFWIVQNGSEGTGMISYNPAMITDEESWQAINYVRTLKGQ